MGLDMYLNAKRHLWTDQQDLGDQIVELFPEIRKKRVTEITVEAIYWRKANAIHKWFVDNVQNGEDNCGYYSVTREQLKRLLELINEALSTRNSFILPPQSGFFFGSTAVDDWYWRDLEQTQKELKQVLSEFSPSWEFYYHSSW